MLLTRETDYALRILRALASGDRMTVQSIADSQMVPKQFAYKIIKKLSKGGLVSIARGAEGGCTLCADLKEVSLYDLMQAVGEDFRVIACMEPGYPCSWQAANGACAAHCQLTHLQQRLDQEFRAHSLHSILFGPEESCS